MIKMFILGVCGYCLYQWWFNPKQLPANKTRDVNEDDYTDYEEVD